MTNNVPNDEWIATQSRRWRDHKKQTLVTKKNKKTFINNMLKGKKILLAISGSIAAYKSILLVRLLVKAGAEVKVIHFP